MATTQTPAVKPAKAKRIPASLVDRTKSALSTATLKGKLTVEELDVLIAHAGKLKSLLS